MKGASPCETAQSAQDPGKPSKDSQLFGTVRLPDHSVAARWAIISAPAPFVETEGRGFGGEHPIAPDGFAVFICSVRDTLPSTALPKKTSDADDLRVDIERLESEAQTHDGRRASDEAHQRSVLRKVVQGELHESDRGFVD